MTERRSEGDVSRPAADRSTAITSGEPFFAAMGKVLSCFRTTPQPDAKPAHLIPPPDGHSSIVQIRSVDLLVSENAQRHHTDAFVQTRLDQPILVVRRGDAFQLRLSLSREYNRDKDAVVFVFTVKDEPAASFTKNTVAVVPLDPLDSNETFQSPWRAAVRSASEIALVVEITPPADVIVGEWTMDIDTKLRSENDNIGYRYTHKNPIYLLFNPWCRQDSVHMPDTKLRYECVLMDSGVIWRGSHSRLRRTVWNYGQFEKDVLECCFYLLRHVGKLPVTGCADVIRVTRHISAVVNSPNEDGVLVGMWKDKFSGGTAPTAWSGSTTILQQFYKNKKSVKYGQCWVFAGVVTTICRALGIPSRCVTNYYSAHDTHGSLTVDQFYDQEGEAIERLNSDSIWNFHVWNEVWMTRPDLSPGDYSGWQVIDATPQEESDGTYRCGPASVKAIKRAEILKPYDGPFIFAEVNADQIFWRYQGSKQPLKLIQKATDKIGQRISTKAVGSFEREDLTHNYKYPESSREERDAMLNALRKCKHTFTRYYLNEELEDVCFDFQLLDDIVIGSPFNVQLRARNKSRSDEYSLHVIMRVESIHYTGSQKKHVKSGRFDLQLKPSSVEEVILNVPYSEYEKVLLDQAMFNIAAMATVNETKYDYFAQDDFRVRMPDIKIEVDGDLVVGKASTVTAGFVNPLPKPLSKSSFLIEGPGLDKPLKITVKQKIPPHEEAKVVFQLTPHTAGPKSILAKFSSKELSDIDGFKEVQVKMPSDNNTLSNEL
ncbi:annulin-like isoform X2 [Ornithodoros turicata]